ncbi:MAG: hypothetical protein Q9201_001384 [Fulgogasparrea decipioides]
MSPHPITIVGAGLAGLTLGRCLRQHGIAAVVLERVSSSPRYNYGITLHPWAFQPLLGVLQMDETTFKETLSIDAARRGTGKTTGDTLAPGIETDPGTFRCHRGRLEKLLQEGQDIRWEHTVQDVRTSSAGISVYLKDEKALKAEVLIGTDGVHSQVRKSLIPSIGLKILPFVVFNGKRRMSNAEYYDLVAPAMEDRTILQSRHNDVVLEISINDFTPKQVDISYTYSRPAHEQDPLHKPDRPIPGATDIPEEFYTALQELKQLPQPFDMIFDPTKVRSDRVLHWLMRSTLGKPAEVEDLAGQGVLLVGDAVHAMPILGGEGANTAMKDGVDLAQHIVRHGTRSLQAFTNARYEAWKKGVEESEKRLADMHGPAKASL